MKPSGLRFFLIFTVTAAISIMTLHGCGPSEEELREEERARQQAVQDSLELAYEQEMEQMRQDSIEQARQDSIRLAEERAQITYSDDGQYSVQIESWRSRTKAQAQVDLWAERGYDHTFIAEFGSAETGDLWFRVRIGMFEDRQYAENLKEKLMEDYGIDSWIAYGDIEDRDAEPTAD